MNAIDAGIKAYSMGKGVANHSKQITTNAMAPKKNLSPLCVGNGRNPFLGIDGLIL